MKLSLNSKILLVFLALLLTLTGLILFISYTSSKEERTGRISEELQVQAYIYQHMLSEMLERGDYEGIQETIALQGADPAILLAAFLDANSRVIAGTRVSSKGAFISTLLPVADNGQIRKTTEEINSTLRIRIWQSADGKAYYMLAPISLISPNERGLGNLSINYYFVQYDLSGVTAAAIANIYHNTIPIISIIGVFLLLLFYVLQKLVTSRLHSLSNNAMSFKVGAEFPEFLTSGNDEISDLAKVLNKLIRNIADEQTKLTSAKQRLEYIQHAAHLGSLVLRSRTGELELSSELIDMFGLNPQESVIDYNYLLAFVHSDDREAVSRVFRYSKNPLDKIEQEFRYFNKNTGDLRFGYLKFSESVPGRTRLSMPDHGQDAHLGSIMDITSLKLAEHALQLTQYTYQKILDNVLESIITFDVNGKIDQANRASVLLFELNRQKLKEKTITQLVELESFNPAQSTLDQYLQTHIGSRDRYHHLETVAWKSNGKPFPARISINHLPGPEPDSRTYILTCSDISSLLEQQRQTAMNEKMIALGQLSGGIAHDFNNIMSVILGFAELLKLRFSDDASEAEKLDEIINATGRAKNLTSMLLSYSKETDRSRDYHDANILLENLSVMLNSVKTARVNLEIILSPAPAIIHVDMHGFSDMILNLALNAIHVMPQGGTLALSINEVHLDTKQASRFNQKSGKYILLTITDNGCGMDEYTVSRIFEPFFSTKGKEGTGLGLAQVYSYLQHNDGAVAVDSTPGAGTTFKVIFPQHKDLPANEKKLQIGPELVDYAGNESILVVDDEISLTELMKKFIEPLGYRIHTAANGMEALQVLEQESIDLMITDMVMPQMDGYDLARAASKRYPELKIIFVTGFDKGRLDEPDMQGYPKFRKPFSYHELVKGIRSIFDAAAMEL